MVMTVVAGAMTMFDTRSAMAAVSLSSWAPWHSTTSSLRLPDVVPDLEHESPFELRRVSHGCDEPHPSVVPLVGPHRCPLRRPMPLSPEASLELVFVIF